MRAYNRGDCASAFREFRALADQGDASAQNNLGLMYAIGEGVPEDVVRACAWSNLAAAQGNEGAERLRAALRQGMISAQIAEGQALGRQLAARIESGSGRAAASPVPADPASPSDFSQDTVQELLALLLAAAADQETEPLEPRSSGSGFVVGGSGDVVTNHHVVDGCARVTVSRAGASHDVRIRATDPATDPALLRASGAVGAAAMFSRSPRANLGEAVTVAGHPLRGLLSSRLNVTSGNVSALAGIGDDPKQLRITAPVQPGNSGGPLLDAAGNVIGVVVSKLGAVRTAELTGDIPQNVNFAIEGALVRGFLDIHGAAYIRGASNTKLAPERLAERARAFTVAVHCWE